MDKLASMETFLLVVERGSFAAAAEASGVSATMVAKQIQAIEKRLGARLIHRTTRRHRLSEVGQLYLERCRVALAGIAHAEASAMELQTSPRGLLRVVAPVGYGGRTLAPVLAKWMSQHPEVSVDLTLNDRPEALVTSGHELGVVIGHLRDQSLVARPLHPYRRILAAAPSYLAAHGTPQHPAELAHHSCLGISYWRYHDRWELVGPANETCTVPVEGRFSASDGGALCKAAAAGAGIVLQPADALADYIAAGQLTQVLPAWALQPTPTQLVYAQDHKQTAKLRSAIDFLVAHLGASDPRPH